MNSETRLPAGNGAEEAAVSWSSAEVWARLESRPAGLRAGEVAARRARWGVNRLERRRRGRDLWREFRTGFTHPMALLLWSGGVVAFLAGMPELGVAILACIVTTQIGNLFAQRAAGRSWRRLDWFGNRLAWLGIAVELILFAAIVYLPPLQRLFGTASLPAVNWLFLVAWIPLLPLADLAWRRWPDRRRRNRNAALPAGPPRP